VDFREAIVFPIKYCAIHDAKVLHFVSIAITFALASLSWSPTWAATGDVQVYQGF
jgi:hypothetical protein